ncbi:hypothetical protein AAFF_G00161350 [Aldrovandia affinis]|uniref:Fibronectin type-III domain-containing protein n=1 Tax=Aldrovandia affinis TaxID=143900 RepID=A0AAD7RMY1_9TELE|nr:hypothetical protein AAFF_G00161350 [Aldrovandia affinis]
MTWSMPETKGPPPLPRSLHSANLIGNKMYVFGGWVPVVRTDDRPGALGAEWICTNSLCELNLDTLAWRSLSPERQQEEGKAWGPRARAGHCTATIGSRLYVWSGRDGYRKSWNYQVCCKDLWYLETEGPSTPPAAVFLIKATISMLHHCLWVCLPRPPVSSQPIVQVQGRSLHKNSSFPRTLIARPTLGMAQVGESAPFGQEPQPSYLEGHGEEEIPMEVEFTQHLYLPTEDDRGTAQKSCTPEREPVCKEENQEHALSTGGFPVNPKPLGSEDEGTNTLYSGGPLLQQDQGHTTALSGSTTPAPVANSHTDTAGERSQDCTWYDVGVFRTLFSEVTHYSLPPDDSQGTGRLAEPQDFEGREKQGLAPGVTYRFRVAGINSCGQGNFSPVNEFKTCQPGFPGAPSSVKITKASDSAHITWESPTSPSGKILEYSMYLAVRKTRSGSAPDPPGQLAFIRIYRGTKTSCTVTSTHLSNAHIDCSARPALVFRIAAKNEQGYGPATQIRWLQDTSKLKVPQSHPQLNAADELGQDTPNSSTS